MKISTQLDKSLIKLKKKTKERKQITNIRSTHEIFTRDPADIQRIIIKKNKTSKQLSANKFDYINTSSGERSQTLIQTKFLHGQLLGKLLNGPSVILSWV